MTTRMAGFLKRAGIWIGAGAVLLLLYLASSTDLFIKEREPQICEISIIIDSSEDDNYVSFRKGVDRAAVELHADVSFITLYDNDSWEQQKDLIERETGDGAQGLILAAVNADAAAQINADPSRAVPIVYVDHEVTLQDNHKGAMITFDYEDLGRQMGEAILKKGGGSADIYFISRAETYGSAKALNRGIKKALSGSRSAWATKVIPDGQEGRQHFLEELKREKPVVLVALDPDTLDGLAALLEENKPDERIRLYGLGSSVRSVKALRRGTITGMCVTDGFAEGYLSVKTLIDRIENSSGTMESQVLSGYYIEGEDLGDGHYENILFPIE